MLTTVVTLVVAASPAEPTVPSPPPAPPPAPASTVAPPPAPEATPAAEADTPAIALPVVDARKVQLAREAARLDRRAKRLFIAGGVIGGIGLAVRVFGSVAVGQSYLSSCEEECYEEVSLLWDLGGAATMAQGAALVGTGFGALGRRQATLDAIGDPARGRGMKRRETLGWSLFGVGLGTYIVTRFAAPFGCPSDECFVGVWEGGFWASASLMGAGLVMGPYARGYELGKRGLKVHDISVAPMSRRGLLGLSISGRF